MKSKQSPCKNMQPKQNCQKPFSALAGSAEGRVPGPGSNGGGGPVGGNGKRAEHGNGKHRKSKFFQKNIPRFALLVTGIILFPLLGQNPQGSTRNWTGRFWSSCSPTPSPPAREELLILKQKLGLGQRKSVNSAGYNEYGVQTNCMVLTCN